jgi:hypoxanthine phosphoribosyltransferase
MEKRYFSYQEIHKPAKSMAERIAAEGFEPDVIVAIGTGGFIPARIIRTFLGAPILAVGIAYYDANDKPTEFPRKVQWIEEAERKLAGKKILLIDEVDDSRTTLEYCIRRKSSTISSARSWTTSGSSTPGMPRTSTSTTPWPNGKA